MQVLNTTELLRLQQGFAGTAGLPLRSRLASCLGGGGKSNDANNMVEMHTYSFVDLKVLGHTPINANSLSLLKIWLAILRCNALQRKR